MIILCWAKSEKCLDPVPPPRLCTGQFEAGGAQMVFEAGGDVVYQGCSSLCLGGSSLSGDRGTYPCALPGGVWFPCYYLLLSSPPVKVPFSSLAARGPSARRGFSLETSQALCQLQRCLFNTLSSSEEAKLSAENHVKEKITKSRENETAKDGKEIAYKYFLISFLSLSPSLLLCPPWLFISG